MTHNSFRYNCNRIFNHTVTEAPPPQAGMCLSNQKIQIQLQYCPFNKAKQFCFPPPPPVLGGGGYCTLTNSFTHIKDLPSTFTFYVSYLVPKLLFPSTHIFQSHSLPAHPVLHQASGQETSAKLNPVFPLVPKGF